MSTEASDPGPGNRYDEGRPGAVHRQLARLGLVVLHLVDTYAEQSVNDFLATYGYRSKHPAEGAAVTGSGVRCVVKHHFAVPAGAQDFWGDRGYIRLGELLLG